MPCSSTLFKLHALKRGALVQLTKGKIGKNFRFFFLKSLFYLFCLYYYFLLLLFQQCFFSAQSYCPFEFYKSEAFISMPLLSALNSGHFKTAILSPSNSVIESRSLYLDGARSLGNDYEENSAEIDKSIRLASLGLAAKNIFQDMVVRRVVGFTRLVKLASNIWDSK